MPTFFTSLSDQALGAFLGALITSVLGVFVARWAFFNQFSKLKRGEFHGQLLVQSHELLPDGNGNKVLCFTTERLYPRLDAIFPNPALEKVFMQRAASTSSTNPLIDLSGIADHAKRSLVSELSSSVEGLEGQYIVLITREAQDAVERKLNRVFLIKQELLMWLRDWQQARTVHMEVEPHWPRLLNLHYAAKRILDENGHLKPCASAFYAEIVFGPRKVLGSVAVDWEAQGVRQEPVI